MKFVADLNLETRLTDIMYGREPVLVGLVTVASTEKCSENYAHAAPALRDVIQIYARQCLMTNWLIGYVWSVYTINIRGLIAKRTRASTITTATTTNGEVNIYIIHTLKCPISTHRFSFSSSSLPRHVAGRSQRATYYFICIRLYVYGTPTTTRYRNLVGPFL